VPRLLVEIGSEEVPASYLGPAAAELERRILNLLAENSLTPTAARTCYTPRRIALLVEDVADQRPAQVVEVQGPPRKNAFDLDNQPTRTAQGFCAAHGKTPAELYFKTTPRGEYVFLKKETEPVPTRRVLEENIAALVSSLPFPKNMRWGPGGLRFARPVRWLLCLLGSDVVHVRLDGLVSDRNTQGRRIRRPRTVAVTSADEYESLLAAEGIIARHDARCAAITAQLNELAASVGGVPVLDEELAEETADITESPEALLCSLDERHLRLPAKVLVTALKKHQRCFAVQTQDGRLLPWFVAVVDNPDCDHRQVAAWYEKAAESRLRDAHFFFDNDLTRGLESLVNAERQVVWIEGMGTYFDKTERLRELCRRLAVQVPGVDAAALDRAAYLSKADLLTDMVREKEYTSLQGTMGGIYARLLGEPESVADAIAEQYLPRAAGDQQPQTLPGALLSIADKVDNIVATFLTGAVPSGSADPFALRRQATGLLSVILDRDLPVDINDLIATSAAAFPSADLDCKAKLPDFFRERLAALLAERGIRYDAVNAVMEDFWPTPTQAMARARALLAFRDRPGFEQLVVGARRVANILRGQEIGGLPQPEALTEPAERFLWQEAQSLEPRLHKALATSAYGQAFELLLGLRATIDRFFDEVLVMAEDESLRANRLRLLAYVRSLFRRVADLSRIVLDGEQP
jgi:glycyl-tRNA synthetase beta chain